MINRGQVEHTDELLSERVLRNGDSFGCEMNIQFTFSSDQPSGTPVQQSRWIIILLMRHTCQVEGLSIYSLTPPVGLALKRVLSNQTAVWIMLDRIKEEAPFFLDVLKQREGVRRKEGRRTKTRSWAERS